MLAKFDSGHIFWAFIKVLYADLKAAVNTKWFYVTLLLIVKGKEAMFYLFLHFCLHLLCLDTVGSSAECIAFKVQYGLFIKQV